MVVKREREERQEGVCNMGKGREEGKVIVIREREESRGRWL